MYELNKYKIFIKKVGKRDDRLNKFIGELEKKNILYTTFNNTEDLKEKIKNSLISTLSECYQDSRDILSYTKEKLSEITRLWTIHDLTHTIEVIDDKGPLTVFRENINPVAESRDLPPVYVQKAKKSPEKIGEFLTTVIHHLYTNAGTHIDFPGHLYSGDNNKKISKFTPEYFIRSAIVLDISDITSKLELNINHGDFRGYLEWGNTNRHIDEKLNTDETSKRYLELITDLKLDLDSFKDRINKLNLTVEPGDFILFYTGLDKYWKNHNFVHDSWEYAYFLNPYLSEELVEYLKNLKIQGIGSDSFRLENPIINLGREIGTYRSAINFLKLAIPKNIENEYNNALKNLMHKKFLNSGILLIEQLTNLKEIKNKKVLLIALPPKIGLDKCDKDMIVRAVAIDFTVPKK